MDRKAQLQDERNAAEGDILFGWLPQLLQMNDSVFPSGGYAHSFGLEGMVQLGLVTDPDSFGDFVRGQWMPALQHVELPFVRLALAAALDRDMTRLLALDERYGAMKGSHELRLAGSRIGSQRLAMLRQLAPDPLWEALDQARLAGRFAAQAPVVFGAQMAVSGTPMEAALAAYYYQSLAGVISAAMKLIRLGQMAAQMLLTECLGKSARVIGEAQTVAEADIGWYQPVIDIASARHERAYTRIFIS